MDHSGLQVNHLSYIINTDSGKIRYTHLLLIVRPVNEFQIDSTFYEKILKN